MRSSWPARNEFHLLTKSSVLVCAIGLALLPAATLHPAAIAMLAIAQLVIGWGYGPITPASSEVLARTAPPSRMALTFSIKQTGVPAGAALGGAILPAIALMLGWQTALIATALLGIAVAALAQRVRGELDSERSRDARGFSPAQVFAPLKLVFANPLLVELAVMAFFEATRQIRASCPGVHISGGVSNLSFSFRGNDVVREAMNSAFLASSPPRFLLAHAQAAR